MSVEKAVVCFAIAIIAVIAIQVQSQPQVAHYYYGNSSNSSNKSHDLCVGYRLPGDRLVLKQSVVKDSSWMRVVVVEASFNTSYYQRVTMVCARDQKTNGNGAYPSLLRGGPGYTYASMRFKSQRGHGINFVVDLYAR